MNFNHCSQRLKIKKTFKQSNKCIVLHPCCMVPCGWHHWVRRIDRKKLSWHFFNVMVMSCFVISVLIAWVYTFNRLMELYATCCTPLNKLYLNKASWEKRDIFISVHMLFFLPAPIKSTRRKASSFCKAYTDPSFLLKRKL